MTRTAGFFVTATLGALAGSLSLGGEALADEPLITPPPPSSIRFMPGASRAISHAPSASRDTAALGILVMPQPVLTGGADFALFAIVGSGLTFRPGFFGMLELESGGETERFLPRPGEEVSLWRGLLGYSAAISFDRFAARTIGRGGAMEGVVSYRFENEHVVLPAAGDATFEREDLPQVGEFIMVDLALRAPFGRWEVETRLQHKFFILVQGDDKTAPYQHAPGADVIVRWKAFAKAHFFTSTFAEFFIGSTPARDAFFFRNLTGVTVPGRIGDLSIFAATDVGHGKGFLVDRRGASLGGGLRISLE
ncbi:MAG TPA: hypothetical protein VE093_39595 [Polyangiaceae bacterium]|nr:hypothetical protein [Polyangiaceae bacterium]